MMRHFVAVALFTILAGKAWADAPLPPPTTKIVCSGSGAFCGFNHANQLMVTLADGSYTAFSARTGQREPLVDRAEINTVR